MTLKSNNALYFGLFSAVVAVMCGVGLCRAPPDKTFTMKLGELSNTAGNSAEVENIGRFAVQQYNKNQNTLLEFGRIVNANEQVVSGKMYHLTLEAVDGGKNKMYEAKVWVKPWMNYKELQEFKEVHDNPVTSPGAWGFCHGLSCF